MDKQRSTKHVAPVVLLFTNHVAPVVLLCLQNTWHPSCYSVYNNRGLKDKQWSTKHVAPVVLLCLQTRS
jgi:hypothetical protein